jgi:FAD/FMN-containing dehydrogenase
MSSSDTLFRQTMEFQPKIDIGPDAPPQLTHLISSYPDLKIYTRSSPHFQNLKSIWNLQYTTNEPLALIRATSTSDVSAVVKYCVSNKIPFTVRSGGHDLWGRSVVSNAVILDIRELNQIVLAEDRESVTIGGGTQTGPLVDFLDAKGLVTPCTLAGIVGHLGWAFMGGFGPLVNTFGLGVDQIIAAKIVTADGKEREADSELLWGIKGAGGAFGVITEVSVKTYELPKLLGGMLMFQFDQAGNIIAGIQTMLETETVPAPLSLGFHFSKRGGVPVLSMMFSWVSTDFEEGRKWLDRIKSFGTVVMDMVGESMLSPFSIHYLALS